MADDERVQDFLKHRLTNLLEPRRLVFTLEINASVGITAARDLQFTIENPIDDTQLEDTLDQVEEIIDEMDSLEDYVVEDAIGIADTLKAQWPIDIEVSLRSEPAKSHPRGTGSES